MTSGERVLRARHQALGDRVTAVFVTGTDFGARQGPFISPRTYRDLYFPFHREVNAWVRRHTSWKPFIHTCASVLALLPDMVESGFDILNPVQTPAAQMDPGDLKRCFGDRLTFWGGGVDTIHNVQAGIPAANLVARYQGFREAASYPVSAE